MDVGSIGSKHDRSEAGAVVRWIQRHCVVPIGAAKGLPVILSDAQRNIIRQVYGNHDRELLIQDPVLASYLALIHTCGIQARARFRPKLNVGADTLWAAAGPSILAVLKRDDNGVVCPGLDTRYPIAM